VNDHVVSTTFIRHLPLSGDVPQCRFETRSYWHFFLHRPKMKYPRKDLRIDNRGQGRSGGIHQVVQRVECGAQHRDSKILACFCDGGEQNHRCPFHFPPPQTGQPLFVNAQEKIETKGEDKIREITLDEVVTQFLKISSDADNMRQCNHQHHADDHYSAL